MQPICYEHRFRTPEKRVSGVTSGVRTRGDPHPHATSLACDAFFKNRDGVLHTVFSANGLHHLQTGHE